MPKAVVAVTNDLTTDQRVDRTCRTLVKLGYEVMLVGRRRRDSVTLAQRPYGLHRMRLLFDKGPLFYAEYNISLFFYLLVHRCDLLVSNDLDTLVGSYVSNRIKRLFFRIRNPKSDISDLKSKIPNPKSGIGHVHDCHEYFRGVPELKGRKIVSWVWKWIEDRIFPKLSNVVAVNQSVANLYTNEYGNTITVVRNMPFRKQDHKPVDKDTLHIRNDQKIILYQGAVNIDRGLEEAILAMRYLKSDAILVIAGIGDVYDQLRQMTVNEGLTEKVRFLGQVPFQDLHGITLLADIGLSIEKDVSINYHYCLPNKFLDYIQAQVPVLVSPFPEMKALVDQYQIGEYINSHDPEVLADQLDAMLIDSIRLTQFKENLRSAAEELCWEQEESRFLQLIIHNCQC